MVYNGAMTFRRESRVNDFARLIADQARRTTPGKENNRRSDNFHRLTPDAYISLNQPNERVLRLGGSILDRVMLLPASTVPTKELFRRNSPLIGQAEEAAAAVVQLNGFDPSRETGFGFVMPDEPYILGRSNRNFAFSDQVSRRHAAITEVGVSMLRVQDLGSTNGTYRYQDLSLTINIGEALREEDFAGRSARQERIMPIALRAAESSMASREHPEHNEDASFSLPESGLFGVFDGVGGETNGEKASHDAAQAAARYLQSTDEAPEQAVRSALHAAHETITTGQTTAVVAKVYQNAEGQPTVTIASAGDSRAYILRDGQLRCITLDHSNYRYEVGDEEARTIQEVLSGAIDIQKVGDYQAYADKRHVIRSGLGSSLEPAIDVFTVVLQPGDKLILTTDGIHDSLTNEIIRNIVSSHRTPNDAADALTYVARQASETAGNTRSKMDDATALVVEVM